MPGPWKKTWARRLRQPPCYNDRGHPIWAIGIGKVEGHELALAFHDGTVYEYLDVPEAVVVEMLADPMNCGCVFIHNIRFNSAISYRSLRGEEVRPWDWTLTGQPLDMTAH